jgi:hypothetical protein
MQALKPMCCCHLLRRVMAGDLRWTRKPVSSAWEGVNYLASIARLSIEIAGRLSSGLQERQGDSEGPERSTVMVRNLQRSGRGSSRPGLKLLRPGYDSRFACGLIF